MKKLLLLLLVFLLVCPFVWFYLTDRCYFLCPIKYQDSIIIRADNRGDGFFATPRSGNRLHQGVDLSADIGTPVLASRLGIVVRAERNKGMGNFVIIRHFGGIRTLYGHLSEIYVRPRQIVRQGDVIGAVGKTGNANYRNIQPHLHFEVKKDGAAQDPLEYLK